MTILRTINTLGVPFTLFTTGRWFEPELVVELLRDLPTCDGLLISLHGPDAATHEAFNATPGSYSDTLANICRATEAGLSVSLSFVINAHNWDKITAMIPLASTLGVQHIVCNRFIGTDDAKLAPTPEQLRHAIATIESLRDAGHPIRFGNCIPQCFAASSSTGCTAGSTFATLDPWGQLRPCNHVPLIAGDVITQSIADLWHGPVMQKWRSLVPSACAACAAFALCHGGCRAQALLDKSPRDFLIQSPLAFSPRLEDVPVAPLYGGLRPQGIFTQRSLDKNILLHRGYAVSVPAFATELVAHLDGSLTLEDIGARYGQQALNWLSKLHTQGFVIWV